MGKMKIGFLLIIILMGISCIKKEISFSDVSLDSTSNPSKDSLSVVVFDTLIYGGCFLYDNYVQDKFLPDSLFSDVPLLSGISELNVYRALALPEFSHKRVINYDLCEVITKIERYPRKLSDEDWEKRIEYIQYYTTVCVVGKLKLNEKYDSYLVASIYWDRSEYLGRLYLINMKSNRVYSVFLSSAFYVIDMGCIRSITRTNGKYFLYQKENEYVYENKGKNHKNEVLGTLFYIDDNGFIQIIENDKALSTDCFLF